MSEIIEGPTCGTYPYPVTPCPSGGHYCAGTYFNYRNDADHQSEKMKEAYAQGRQSMQAEVDIKNKQLKEAQTLLAHSMPFVTDYTTCKYCVSDEKYITRPPTVCKFHKMYENWKVSL